jgi:hypothetical protein
VSRRLALALCLAAGVARAGEPDVRRAFRLEGERGEVAFRDDLVTLYSSAAPQSVRIAGARAEPSAAHLARSAAHRPGLCDPLDQVDLGARLEPGLRAALPPAAKVKRVVSRGEREVAVYSLPGERRYHETWVALLARTGREDERRLLKFKRISEGSGTFCGAHPLGARHLLLLVEGESGGREVLIAYGLAVEP